MYEISAIKVYSNELVHNNQGRILPKQIIKQTRRYSTIISQHQPSKVNSDNPSEKPFFITGLTDAEGSFVTIVKKNTNSRVGWRVDNVFQIGLHKKDVELLKSIQAYFGGIGVITKAHQDMCAFRVSSPKQIKQKILPHFEKYPLVTQKRADYLLFREIILKMLQGEQRRREFKEL